MKRCLTGWLIWLCLFSGCFVAIAEAGSLGSQITPDIFKKGIIWQIKSPQGKLSHVIGTMHVSDPGVWKVFGHAKFAYDSASIVCTEVKLDFVTMAAEMQSMFFTDGRTLRSVINNKALYRQVVSVAKSKGYPEALVSNMKPFSVTFLLNMPASKGRALDEKIFSDAVLAGKQVCGLETVEEHSHIFKIYTLEQQIRLLKHTLNHANSFDKIYPAMLAAYVDRDLLKLAKMTNQSLAMGDETIENRFIQKFLIDRNIKMVQRMEPLIKKGKAFFAIGAMHLPGKAGVLRLLQDKGYEITRVY